MVLGYRQNTIKYKDGLQYYKLTLKAMRRLQCSVYTFKQHVQSSYQYNNIHNGAILHRVKWRRMIHTFQSSPETIRVTITGWLPNQQILRN